MTLRSVNEKDSSIARLSRAYVLASVKEFRLPWRRPARDVPSPWREALASLVEEKLVRCHGRVYDLTARGFRAYTALSDADRSVVHEPLTPLFDDADALSAAKKAVTSEAMSPAALPVGKKLPAVHTDEVSKMRGELLSRRAAGPVEKRPTVHTDEVTKMREELHKKRGEKPPVPLPPREVVESPPVHRSKLLDDPHHPADLPPTGRGRPRLRYPKSRTLSVAVTEAEEKAFSSLCDSLGHSRPEMLRALISTAAGRFARQRALEHQVEMLRAELRARPALTAAVSASVSKLDKMVSEGGDARDAAIALLKEALAGYAFGPQGERARAAIEALPGSLRGLLTDAERMAKAKGKAKKRIELYGEQPAAKLRRVK